MFCRFSPKEKKEKAKSSARLLLYSAPFSFPVYGEHDLTGTISAQHFSSAYLNSILVVALHAIHIGCVR